jgi:hypothetical protein
MNMTNDSAHRAALEAGYTARALARAKLEQAGVTLTRAQRVAATATEKVQNLERTIATAEIDQAYRLEAAIIADGPTAGLPDVAAEGLASALSSARLNASIAAKALESLQATQRKRQAEVTEAEAAVVAAVDQIQSDDDIELARQLSHHLSEAVRIGKALLFMAIADETNGRRQAPPEVTEALGKLDLPLIDRRHIAINIWKQGDTAAYAQRAARRAALIAGDSADTIADEAA